MKKTLLNKSIRIRAQVLARAPHGVWTGIIVWLTRALSSATIENSLPRSPEPDDRLTFLGKADVMLIPSREFAILINRCFHILEATDSKKIIVDIIGSSPSQLHRHSLHGVK